MRDVTHSYYLAILENYKTYCCRLTPALCVAVYCSVLQCVAVCCSVLQCVAVAGAAVY